MRRILWSLGVVAVASVALAACGGGGSAEEVEQLQADVAGLEGTVDGLRGEVLEARGAVEKQEEALDDVSARIEDLSAQIGAGEDSGARLGTELAALERRLRALSERVGAEEAGAVERGQALTAIEEAVAELSEQLETLLRGPLVGYFRQVERLSQAYDASTEAGGEVFEAALAAGELGAARSALDGLVTASRVLAADFAAVAAPAQVAVLHEEAVEALRATSVAVAQLAPALAEATTLEAFQEAFIAFAESADVDAIEARSEAACQALQDFAGEIGIDVDLVC